MLPKYHIFFGILCVIILHFVFPQISWFNLAIVFLSSVLIDGDHYLYFILEKKNFSLIKALNWYREKSKIMCSFNKKERKKVYTGFYLFHGVEWIILLAILGRFIFPPLTYVAIGFLLHLAVDIPSEIYLKGTVHKVSIIYSFYLFSKKNLS
jgi:hypothetical protein